ncbi:hypothetical protein [Micromonospora sp. NPDC049662]|uniref:hypothetical protein n=1 Tax=Micromonospora sp. NPDC049662 TaxID=3155397 RepID=UPI00341EDF3D
MKITSAGEGAADTGSRRVKSAVATVVGLFILVQAWTVPWVSVRPGLTTLDQLIGSPPSTEVRTFALTELPGYWQPLCVGWVALLALPVVAWVRPPWRFGLRLAAMLLGMVLGIGTLLPATAAIDVSGFPLEDRPSTTLLGGVWLGLVGVVLLVRAVTTLPELPAPAAVPAVDAALPAVDAALPAVDAALPAADATLDDERAATIPPAVPESTPFVWQGSRPNVRTMAPWWRRPAPIVGVVAVLGVAGLLVTVTWHAIGSAQEQQLDALDTLVVAAPVGSTTVAPAAGDDQVDLGRVLPLSRERTFLLAEQADADVVHVAGSAWTQPDGTSISITLLEFNSTESANQFRRSYADLQQVTPGELAELASVPGSTVFIGAERPGVWAVAGRDQLIVIASAAGGSAGSVPIVESLVRAQLDRF